MTNQITQLLTQILDSISDGIIQTQKQISEHLQNIFGTASKASDADDDFFSQDDLDSLLADTKKA